MMRAVEQNVPTLQPASQRASEPASQPAGWASDLSNIPRTHILHPVAGGTSFATALTSSSGPSAEQAMAATLRRMHPPSGVATAEIRPAAAAPRPATAAPRPLQCRTWAAEGRLSPSKRVPSCPFRRTRHSLKVSPSVASPRRSQLGWASHHAV